MKKKEIDGKKILTTVLAVCFSVMVVLIIISFYFFIESLSTSKFPAVLWIIPSIFFFLTFGISILKLYLYGKEPFPLVTLIISAPFFILLFFSLAGIIVAGCGLVITVLFYFIFRKKIVKKLELRKKYLKKK